MCARGAQVFSWQQLFAHLSLTDTPPEGGLQRFNLSPSQAVGEGVAWTRVPAVVSDDSHSPKVHGMIWPLIPYWCHGELPRFSTANCRSEPDEAFTKTVASKPAFRDAWQKNRRCLIPFSWFYEWDQRTKPKQPWMVSLKNEAIMMMAGLWDTTQTRAGDTWLSCTIMTTAPNDLLQSIGHHRSPVLIEKEHWHTWLSGSANQAQDLLQPPPSNDLQSQPVSMKINNPKFNEDIRIIDNKP
jgi:putative SOS response-associated peptidase YedK